MAESIPIHPSIVVLPSDTEDIHLAAYNQGWEAFNAGYPEAANPYALIPSAKHLADWWVTGWMGFEEDEGDFMLDWDDEPPDFW